MTVCSLIRLAATAGIPAAPSRIDRPSGTLSGFVVAAPMIARGHGVELDQTSLAQIVALGNKNPQGIKSRFNHPNASGDALGSFLGRATNFRLDEGVVRADLTLAAVSFDSPQGDLGNYILDRAEEDPESFGASVVIKHHPELRLNPDGTRIIDPETGDPLPPLVRVDQLKAVDLVDSPGATDSFFSDPEQARDWPARQATQLLDHVFTGLSETDIQQRVTLFLDQYFAHRNPSNEDSTMSEQTPSTPDTASDETTTASNEGGGQDSAQPETDDSQMSSASQPDLEETKLAAKREEAKRQSDIRALCATAGMSEKSDAFCENLEFSVSDVRAALFESLCKRNKTPAEDGDESVPGQSAADPDKAFQEEYREQSALFSEQGISEEQYVASRRIDEGLDHLAMLTPAA